MSKGISILLERNDHLQATIQIGDLSLRTSDPWGRACDGFEGSGGCTFLSSYNGDHLDQLLSSSASSIFALRTLKSHSLRPPLLHQVAIATTVASLLYASSAWWGLATAEDKTRMERLLVRLRRGGYLPADFPSVETLAVAADHQLFVSIASNPYHVLRRLYHEKEAC